MKSFDNGSHVAQPEWLVDALHDPCNDLASDVHHADKSGSNAVPFCNTKHTATPE